MSLAQHSHNGQANLDEIIIDKAAQNALHNYEWQGNVRELSNVLERTMSVLEGNIIHIQDLPFYLHPKRTNSSNPAQVSLKDVKALTEIETIQYALREADNNKVKAAKILGIHRTQLYKKMKKYNISLSQNP